MFKNEDSSLDEKRMGIRDLNGRCPSITNGNEKFAYNWLLAA
jgi:hypothetical protein